MRDLIEPLLARVKRRLKAKETIVILPDMFQSFLKQEPNVNPHYEVVKHDSEQWLNEFCSFQPRMQMKIKKCDFSYFCAIAAPYASPTEFRTLCDWGNWVFPYDDMFDNGELRDQPEESERIMRSLMMPMLGLKPNDYRSRIVQVHDDVVRRVWMDTSTGVQKRFAQAMGSYCMGALTHVDDQFLQRSPNLEEMILIRRQSAGVRPLYHLIEYAHHLQVPDEVFDDPAIQELEILGIDMVSISNDILSYRKEQAEGVPHNMVAVCRSQGMSAQHAFNAVGRVLEDRYRQWDKAEANVPSWDALVDLEVQKYIDGIKSVVHANLRWSFKSERYLGSNPDKVRRTRRLRIIADGAPSKA